MLLLNREEILSVFSMRDAIEADKTAFRLIAEGKCDIPLRTNIQAPRQDASLLFMPAYDGESETAALKIIGLYPHNPEKGLPASPAQVMLIDGKTGLVSAVLDGVCVTQLRTGAASGAAFDVLARKDAKIGALIGTGGQAATQLEAMLTARKLEEVRIFGIERRQAECFAAQMQEKFLSCGTRIVLTDSSDEAVQDADLLITVTPSGRPVFDGRLVKKGATVSCVGSYQHHMQEMDPVILTRASKIYFDSQEAVLAEAGDIRIPLEQGLIAEADFTGNLGDVIGGKLTGRADDGEIIVFKTVGLAVQDLIAAKEILARALQKGVGTRWGE